MATLFLQSCANNAQKPSQKPLVKNSESVSQPEKNSGYFLAQAKQQSDLYTRNDLLLQAAQALQTEQECEQSIRMLALLQPELQDSRQLTLANLIQAECYLLLSNQGLAKAEQLFNQLSFDYGYSARIAALATQIYQLKKMWLSAARAVQKLDTPPLEQAQLTWQYIKRLSLAELEKARLTESSLQAWLQLAIITKRYALQPEQFNQELANWQLRHSGHPLVETLPEDIVQLMALPPIEPQKVAILLPLSGRLANQGTAVKEGILAAYFNQLSESENKGMLFDKQISFIDTNLKTAAELNTLVADYDVVIGPLVKDKIAELSKLLPADKLLLALNRLAENQTSLATLGPEPKVEVHKEQYYFALAPEDEAEQLAEHIQQQGLIRPVIFAANSEATQRMAEAFINKWQQTANAMQPDLSIFTDNKDMRERVSDMLDVSQSKARIGQIERLADVEVFGVERNRLDIDAIVLFANSEQTELLNPIIEASLSPFARNAFSVFASSRSYSLNLSNNSIRDLRNLTFTDMPWMLPEHNWQTLADEIQQLWPQKHDALLRLFAMGYDAYHLLPNLRRLKTLSHTASQGLTGDIYIDPEGVIHRRLPLAKVLQDRVQVLDLD
ncbi:penicillin-binding protein activator [Paraglaciecola aestuariivivens]